MSNGENLYLKQKISYDEILQELGVPGQILPRGPDTCDPVDAGNASRLVINKLICCFYFIPQFLLQLILDISTIGGHRRNTYKINPACDLPRNKNICSPFFGVFIFIALI